jgi:TonB family protein
VALSQEPNFYRSGLLKVLHFCLGSKMAGISAIAGSSLKRRIDHMRLIESWQTTVTSRNRAALALFLISVLASFLAAGWVHIRSASAQSTGDLSGKVFDASGASIPGARVVFSSPELRNKEVVFSGADGQFNFAALPAGTYLWAVSQTGFRTREGKVTVNSQNQARLDVVLEIGEVFMSVGVVGRSPRLSSPPSTPGSVPRRAQVGGNVQQMNLVSQVNPSYPEHLQAQGIEGVVLLEVIVDKEGTSRAVRVANTLAHPELAESAVEAVKQWRYQPALLNGQPIEVVTEITVNFELPPQ